MAVRARGGLLEHPVGDFKVDILCSDNGGKVIIHDTEDEPTLKAA